MSKGLGSPEFVKAARTLYGGRWQVPVAQRAGMSVGQLELEVREGVSAGLAAVMVDLMTEHEDRLAKRRAALQEAVQ